MAGKRLVVLAGAGAVGPPGPAGPSAVPANDVILGTPNVSYSPPDAQGKIYAHIVIPFTKPSPLGTWDHVSGMLFAPDDTVTRSKAIVRTPSGSSGFFIGAAGVASNLSPIKRPIPFGPFTGYELAIVIDYRAPADPESWRVYAPSGSVDVENPLATVNQGGTPSPNAVFTVNPPPTLISGEEFVPLADSFTSATPPPGTTGTLPFYSLQAGADQMWGFAVQWTNKTWDPRYSLLDGYDVKIEYESGHQELQAAPNKNDLKETSQFWPVADGKASFILWLVSRDIYGNRNTIVDGVTPSIRFTVEYQSNTVIGAPLSQVTDFTVTTAYTNYDQNGKPALLVTPFFKPPADDSKWSYGDLWVRREDNHWYNMGGVSLGFGFGVFTVAVTNGGSGYSTPPSVSFSGGGGSGATAHALVSGGAVTSVVVDIGGQNFTSVPDVVFGGSGTGAVATADLEGLEVTALEQLPVFSFPWKFLLVSKDSNGRDADGKIVTDPRTPPNGTPAVVLTVDPKPDGSSGVERAPLVTGLALTGGLPKFDNQGDGVEKWGVDGTWTPPDIVSYPNYGGMKLVLRPTPSGDDVVISYYGPKDNTFNSPFWDIGATQAYYLYAVSMDTFGRENSLVPGVTPRVGPFTISLQTAGRLKGNRMDASTLEATLAINLALLGVAPHSIANAQLTTSELTIGGTAGTKVIRFRFFNASGSAIAWMGDDTANSGFVGLWAKQGYFGGTGPSGAPLTLDSNGKFAISIVPGTSASHPFKITDAAGGTFDLYDQGAPFGMFLDMVDGSTAFRTNISATSISVSDLTQTIALTPTLNSTTHGLYINGVKVIGARIGGPANSTDSTDVALKFNLLLLALRGHGLIS